jgi:hypothetical protein
MGTSRQPEKTTTIKKHCHSERSEESMQVAGSEEIA